MEMSSKSPRLAMSEGSKSNSAAIFEQFVRFSGAFHSQAKFSFRPLIWRDFLSIADRLHKAPRCRHGESLRQLHFLPGGESFGELDQLYVPNDLERRPIQPLRFLVPPMPKGAEEIHSLRLKFPRAIDPP